MDAAAEYTSLRERSFPDLVVDLRSDTLTKPTEAMRAAMAAAEVGDDVFEEDPTVQTLQNEVAALCGKEAGLFVPSGTMGNLIAALVHCKERGSEVILGDNSHMHIYEQGGVAALGGIHPRTLPNQADGSLDLAMIEAAIRTPDDHHPVTQLICLENTHNRCGGRVLSVEYIEAVGAVARKHGLKLHIDGARIFNAATALQVPVRDLVRAADSVSVCLSKGLGAPLGTVLVGDAAFVRAARRSRKMLGGGMRQVGVVAAAGLIAISDMAGRLEDDHRNARALAEGLSRIKGLAVDLKAVETNMVLVEVTGEAGPMNAIHLSTALAQRGVHVLPRDERHLRLVTHHHITHDHVTTTLSVFRDLMA